MQRQQQTQDCNTTNTRRDSDGDGGGSTPYALIVSAPNLYTYCDVRVEKSGTVYTGDVTTHLNLEDWSLWHGYKLLGFEHRDFANSQERTKLTAVVPKNGPPSQKRTILGIPAPAPGPTTPIVASIIKMIG